MENRHNKTEVTKVNEAWFLWCKSKATSVSDTDILPVLSMQKNQNPTQNKTKKTLKTLGNSGFVWSLS